MIQSIVSSPNGHLGVNGQHKGNLVKVASKHGQDWKSRLTEARRVKANINAQRERTALKK